MAGDHAGVEPEDSKPYLQLPNCQGHESGSASGSWARGSLMSPVVAIRAGASYQDAPRSHCSLLNASMRGYGPPNWAPAGRLFWVPLPARASLRLQPVSPYNWCCLAFLICVLLSMASASKAAGGGAAITAAALPYRAAGRRVLQQTAAPPPPPLQPQPDQPLQATEQPQTPPPPPRDPGHEQEQELTQPPQQPTLPPSPPPLPPPPPPAYVGVASTSRDFFRLLYAGPSITEIRLAKDITLQAADAAAALEDLRAAGAGIAGGGGAPSADEDVAAAAALGVGAGGPSLTYNLTIVGYSRGTHTRLDTNFLVAIIRLTPGVRLTLRNVELYKAQTQVGQIQDFLGKSRGGVLVLDDCVQRRAVCMPFSLAVAQILSLPPALEMPYQPPREVSLRNDSAFCWSTSTLLPTCKQPAVDVRSLALHVAPRDGILVDSGGYDVSHSESYVVCDFPVDAACVQTSTADQCMSRELIRRFGDNAVPPPPGGSGAALAPGEGDAGGDNGRSLQLVVGLVVGLAGGALVLLCLVVGVLVLRNRRRRRRRAAADKAAGGGGSGGGGAPGASARAVLHDDDEEAGVLVEDGTAAAGTASGEAGRKQLGTDLDRSGPGAAGGGGGGTTSSCSSREGDSTDTRGGALTFNGKAPQAAAAALSAPATAAGDRSRLLESLDVESIRRSLLLAAQRHQPEGALQAQVLQLLGEGSFGKVYKALWQGTVVALKALVLSGNLSQDQRRRQMAVMEAAISSSMSHPNIVQTYTYSFRPIRDVASPDGTAIVGSSSTQRGSRAGAGAGGSGGDGREIRPDGAAAAAASSGTSRVYGHELLLVLEYCDRGSLRQALDAGVFHRHGSGAAGGDAQAPLPDVQGSRDPADASWLTPAAEFSTLTGPPPPPTPPMPPRSQLRTGAAVTSPDRDAAGAPQQQNRGDCPMVYNYGLMLQVACDVASALLHLHSHGVVHGDVKASNVLLKTAALDERRYLLAETAQNLGGGGGDISPGADGIHVGRFAGPASASGAVAAPPLAAASPQPSASAAGTGSLPPLGLTAKVADFGLSTVMGYEGDSEKTHITALTAQGSLTHMAPELMLHGHISKRVDVYAFGIMLYELFSGERAHRGVPRALLPHQVAVCGLRPSLPPHTPPDLRHLAEACWAAEPTKRPTFEVILEELKRMRSAHVAAAAAAAVAASRGASFSTSASRGFASAGGGTFSFQAVRPDGWVMVPPLESRSTLFEELLGTREGESRVVGGAGGGGGGGATRGTAPGDALARKRLEEVPTLTLGQPVDLTSLRLSARGTDDQVARRVDVGSHGRGDDGGGHNGGGGGGDGGDGVARGAGSDGDGSANAGRDVER